MKGPFFPACRSVFHPGSGPPDSGGGVDNDVGCVPEGDQRGGKAVWIRDAGALPYSAVCLGLISRCLGDR